MKVNRGSYTPNQANSIKSDSSPKTEFNLELATVDSSKKSDASPEIHQSARKKVFEDIVRRSLENPESPFFTMLPNSERRKMASAITEELVNSHYLS